MGPKFFANCRSSKFSMALMRGRCGADDSRRRRGYEALAQSLGHDEIGHVIERERIFEPVFGELARAEHCARIVDQDIDTGLRSRDFGGDPLHFRDARQIGIMDRMGKAGRCLAKPRQRPVAARSVSRHKDDPGAHFRELFGSDLSDAGGASTFLHVRLSILQDTTVR